MRSYLLPFQFARMVSICLLVPAAFAQPVSLLDIQVAGAVRFSPQAIIAASGLKPEDAVTAADFDAAAARLGDTGLFTNVSYRYDPKTSAGKSGYALTLEIQEAPPVRGVRLDFPGVDEQQLWQEIRRENGLADAQMPVNPQSEAYYKGIIAAALRTLNHAQEIVSKNEVDFETKKGTIVFQGANLPKIVGVAFEGNKIFDTKALDAAVARVAFMGEGYSEHLVRLLLDQNIKPMYEERGHLTVGFPRVEITNIASGVSVSIAIDEGPAWNLGKVELHGDAVPTAEMLTAAKFGEGKLANWKQIQASVGNAESVLKRGGYLGVRSQVARTYHNETGVVDLAININKGKQYLFGALTLEGLNPADELQARNMWELPAGAPVNPFYIDDYLRSLAKTMKFKSVAQQLRPRAGSDVMDLTILTR